MVLPDGYFLQHKKYQLTHTIGQGGFGITYLGVWNTEVKGGLGKMKTTVPVCIKEYFFKDYCYRDKESYAVKVHSATGEKLFGRFKEKLIKEANILSAVHHPYIVNVLEVFEENNTAYIIMEYIKGCSLKYMLEKESVLSENKALKYIHQVGGALAFVHEKNIVHLDIKPGNVLIDQNDNARLIDFGVSKRYDIEEQETSTTTLTLSKGFASIEQYDDEGMQTFSPCPDIYSLGATMYNLLTGVVPVESILRATKQLLPPSAYNSNITPKTEQAILKAMEIKPEDRFRSVKDMLAAMDAPPYELAENKLIEEARQGGVEDHTELIRAAGASATTSSSATTEDDDRTIVTSAGKKKENESSSEVQKKSRRKILLAASVLLCAFIGYAIYNSLSDGFFVLDKGVGVRIPDDSLSQVASGVKNMPDDALVASQSGHSPESKEQSSVGDENAVSSRAIRQPQTQRTNPSTTTTGVEPSTRSTTEQPANVPDSQARQSQDTSVSNVDPDGSSMRENGHGIKVYTNEELASFEQAYQALLSAGKNKMEPPVRDYAGALDDFRKASEIVKSTRIKNTLEEVDHFIKICNEKIEEKERKERLANYKTYYDFGDLKIARNEATKLFGAINADGREVIPCKYVTTNKRPNSAPEFLRKDGLVDIYDNEGKLTYGGLSSSE